MAVRARKEVPVESDGQCQGRERGGLGRRWTIEHHSVAEVVDQLMVQATVGLVCDGPE